MAKYVFKVLRKQLLELEIEAADEDNAYAEYDDAIADDFEVVAADWELTEIEEVE
jgi:hypothetical protein